MKRTGFAMIGNIVALATGLLGLSVGNAQTPVQPVAIDLPAPELIEGEWLNTPEGKPIKLADRKGKVTVVQFWTFG